MCRKISKIPLSVDRSGLVGADGSTHQGIFDISYLSELPNMTILSPKNRYELEDALDYAYAWNGPVAIRYPRGTASVLWESVRTPIEYGKSEVLNDGKGMAILSVGNMLEEATIVYERLKAEGMNPTLVNARFLKPLDTELIRRLANTHETICTLEENIYAGGYGQAVGAYLQEQNLKTRFVPIAIKDQFVPHGSIDQLRKMLQIDGESVAAILKKG